MGEETAFDHLLHWVPDVPSAVAAYRAAGLPAHTAIDLDGFQNGGWRLDERYIEILSVTNESALATSRYAPGVELIRPAIEAKGGPGAITFAVDVGDVHAHAERLRAIGMRTEVFEVTIEEAAASFTEVFLLDGPAWLPFFITYSPPREQILAGIPDGAFDPGVHDLVGIVVTSPDPAAAAALASRVLDLPVEGQGLSIDLPGARLTFSPGDREEISAIRLSGPGRNTVVDGLAVEFDS